VANCLGLIDVGCLKQPEKQPIVYVITCRKLGI
jgi:hypothetical protein